MTNFSCFFSFCDKPKSMFLFSYFIVLLLLGFALTFPYPTPALAFFSSKDSEAIHARFDLIESKVDILVQTLKNLHETALRNQADIKLEIIALRDEFVKVTGLTEETNRQTSKALEDLSVLLEENFQKIGEFNQAFFEQDKKNKEIYQENVRLELENISSKISDLAAIYKTSAQEEIERENNNILNFNKKMEEVNAQAARLVKVYKNIAIEETTREKSMIASFNKQLKEVNSKISQLIKIYKQSISAVTTSNKTGLGGLNKRLESINTRIKQLTEIYRTSIKENNDALTTISKNLTKELQSINNKLSNSRIIKPSKTKPSPTKK